MSTEDGEEKQRSFTVKPKTLTLREAGLASRAAESVANAASEGTDISPNLERLGVAAELGIVSTGAADAIKENIAGRIATNEAEEKRRG